MNKRENKYANKWVIVGALSILTIAFAVFCILTLTGVFSNLDATVHNRFANWVNPLLTTFARVFTFAGFFPLLIVVGLLIELVNATRHKIGFQLSLAAGLGYTINHLFKLMFQRPRPDLAHMVTPTGLSFPSGHSTAAAAFFVSIIIFVIFNVKDATIYLPAIVVCVVMPFVVAFCRVYLGVHYMSDTITGIFLGTIVAIFVNLILWPLLNRKLKRFKRVHKFLFGKVSLQI